MRMGVARLFSSMSNAGCCRVAVIIVRMVVPSAIRYTMQTPSSAGRGRRLEYPRVYKDFFRPGAGLKPTVLLALMRISVPVRGLLLLLATRYFIVKVPKPG